MGIPTTSGVITESAPWELFGGYTEGLSRGSETNKCEHADINIRVRGFGSGHNDWYHNKMHQEAF